MSRAVPLYPPHHRSPEYGPSQWPGLTGKGTGHLSLSKYADSLKEPYKFRTGGAVGGAGRQGGVAIATWVLRRRSAAAACDFGEATSGSADRARPVWRLKDR
jgi:hypothetical protein